MRKARQSGFSFAEALVTMMILAFVAIGIVLIAPKKNTFNVNVKAKHGTYECFIHPTSNQVCERYGYLGGKTAVPTCDKTKFKAQPPKDYDCAFAQPAYINTFCINISGGGAGGSLKSNGLGGAKGETKSLCLSSAAGSGTTYRIKLGKGGDAGRNGEESKLEKTSNPNSNSNSNNVTAILRVAGGITGIDTADIKDREKGEESGFELESSICNNCPGPGSGGDAGKKGKGGYVIIEW